MSDQTNADPSGDLVERLRDKHFVSDEAKAGMSEEVGDLIYLFRREREEAAALIEALHSGKRVVLAQTVEHAENLYTVAVACLKGLGRDPEAASTLEALKADRDAARELNQLWTQRDRMPDLAKAHMAERTRAEAAEAAFDDASASQDQWRARALSAEATNTSLQRQIEGLREALERAAESLTYNAVHLVAENDLADALLTVERMRAVLKDVSADLRDARASQGGK